jgi:heme exporter protein D
MMGSLDFTSWRGLVATLASIVLVSLVAVSIRLLMMQTVQRRRERENRQINERLKTLIAAYKTLGGSFTGELIVDPTHLRDLRRRLAAGEPPEQDPALDFELASPLEHPALERRRRTRDAVEAALSDVILLGTEEQVRLAAEAAADMVAGRKVGMARLVVSLRDFIRRALDLEPIPHGLLIPDQGPLRPGSSGGGGKGGDKGGGRGGGGGGAAGGAAGTGGAGMGEAGIHADLDDPDGGHRGDGR